MNINHRRLITLFVAILCATSCASSTPPPPPASVPSGSAAFDECRSFVPRGCSTPDKASRRGRPISGSTSTTIGSRTIRARRSTEAVASARQFRDRVAAIDAASLSADRQLDREQLLHAIDSRLLTLDVIRPWADDPDIYSSGLTSTAYMMIKRDFAPPDERLRQLIAREKAMPAALAEARKNLDNPPTDLHARSPSNSSTATAGSSRRPWRRRLPTVTDKALLAEFKQANDAVIAALAEYKKWLQDDLLKRSNGDFAIGAETYRKKLAADEMIELPLDELLAIAERDLRKNQAAFAETARAIDPKRARRPRCSRRSKPIIRRPRSCCRPRRPSSMRWAAS